MSIHNDFEAKVSIFAITTLLIIIMALTFFFG